MKKLLLGLLALGSISSFAQSNYDFGYKAAGVNNSIPDVVSCGQIKKIESYGSGEIALSLVDVKTGFLGETIYSLKKDQRIIRFSGRDDQEIQVKSMSVKAQLLADKMMNKTVCISTEYIDHLNSVELINHITTDYSLEDALMKLDQQRGTNTKF